MIYLILAVLVGIILYVLKSKKNHWDQPKTHFPKSWRNILLTEVAFYRALNAEEKELFEYKIHEFLINIKIIGVSTEVELEDKILVAASAVIPIFSFPEWTYPNLTEVLIYPNHFDTEFNVEGEGRNTLGMVGNGYMEGKMLLSQKALHQGFKNEKDGRNTAIHEFVHLIDKYDGMVDGIPHALLEKQYTIPWIELVDQKRKEIHTGTSDINPYGGISEVEFFAVVAEYFFEKPKSLKINHPELYEMFEEIFDHDLAVRTHQTKLEIQRNDPCPCQSGLKFKHCCKV
jgi:hypothetical protein